MAGIEGLADDGGDEAAWSAVAGLGVTAEPSLPVSLEDAKVAAVVVGLAATVDVLWSDGCVVTAKDRPEPATHTGPCQRNWQ